MTYNLFDIYPNWESGIQISYGYSTVIEVSRYQREQRKALMQRPLRKMRAVYRCKTFQDRMKIEHFIMANQAGTTNVPIWTEPMRPVLDTDLFGLGGASPIELREDPSEDYRFNLIDLSNIPNTTTLYNGCAIDHVGAEASQIINIQTLVHPAPGAPYYLDLQANLSLHLIGATTFFFPTFEGALDSVDISDITDTMRDYDITFSEVP